MTTESLLKSSLARARNREDLWIEFINAAGVECMAEIGVFRGEFAARILEGCSSVSRYYMIDPWRHLDDWNKPANRNSDVFEEYFREAMDRTAFADGRRTVLRGTTAEVIDRIPEGSLDFAYIDGDHTLRGITIDLVKVMGKVREGGWIAGDDFGTSAWQHRTGFEPSLVFPFAVHFAESVNQRIFALPYNQFLMEKVDASAFAFIDPSGRYADVTLLRQFGPGNVLRRKLAEVPFAAAAFLRKAARVVRRIRP